MCTYAKIVSKDIAIADDVYEALKREKGDRSFSDVIRDRIEDGGSLADVAGAGVLDEGTSEAVTDDIERMSRGTLSSEDETL